MMQAVPGCTILLTPGIEAFIDTQSVSPSRGSSFSSPCGQIDVSSQSPPFSVLLPGTLESRYCMPQITETYMYMETIEINWSSSNKLAGNSCTPTACTPYSCILLSWLGDMDPIFGEKLIFRLMQIYVVYSSRSRAGEFYRWPIKMDVSHFRLVVGTSF